MEQLLVWVKKLAVFMILCSYMEHLLPAQYKRYFHMCTGLILILMITSPLRQVLQGNIGSEVSCLLENLRTGSQVYQMKGEGGKRYQAYYMKQYKAAMTEQIRNLADMSGLRAEEIRLSVNEDVSSDSYGCPTEVSMHVLSEDGMEADNGSKKQFRQLLSQQLGMINQQLATLDTTCQSAVDDLNAKIRDYNDKVDTAKNAAANSKATIDSAVSELQAKKDQTTDETAKADLQAAIDKLNAAKSAADGLSGLEKASEVSVTIPTIDTTAIQQEMGAISVSMKTFQQTAQTLTAQLPAMQEKLQTITSMKDKLPAEAIGQLSESVDQLDAGMQGLNIAIGTFSSNLGELNKSVQAQFPAAVTGILELNSGFSQLSANNDALLAGANKLKANSSTLVAGVQTLQSGTNQLASGLNTLGSQMSSGAAKLSLNSAALREGAATLQSGARELADGMEKFDREGTSKLKSTVEDELGDVLDRFDALTSDDCTYTTFSGKDSGMEGSVKFVIETEAIE